MMSPTRQPPSISFNISNVTVSDRTNTPQGIQYLLRASSNIARSCKEFLM